MTVQQVYDWLDAMAPFDTAEDFDNCGLLVGDPNAQVERIGLALDITREIIDKAVAENITLIITHHPVIFHPMKRIVAKDVVYTLIQRGISVISAHTNLDKAAEGINTVLADFYGLQDITSPVVLDDLGRVGVLPQSMSVSDYAAMIRQNLKAQAVRYLDMGHPVQKVGYVSGSGGSLFSEMLSCGVDTIVTGDIKHDLFVSAQNIGVNLIEAGHFDSENVIFDSLSEKLQAWSGLPVHCLSVNNPVQYHCVQEEDRGI